MFEILFLGTAGSVPSKERQLSSTLVGYFDTKFLIDCADGTQYPLLLHGGSLSDCLRVLITHEHLDHLIGLGGLLYTLDIRGVPLLLEIYAGEAAMAKIRALIGMAEIGRGLQTKLVEISPGIIWEDDRLRCVAFKTDHTDCSYGFTFEEKERRHFLPAKADELRVPQGKLRKQLVSGETVLLPDGRSIQPDMVLTAPRKGTKVAYTGDAAYRADLIGSCEAADCLIAEATYLELDNALAARYKHLTAKQAASIARQSGVITLYLNHISTRYREEAIIDEAVSEFPRAFVAHDLQLVKVRKGEPKNAR